MTKTEKYSQAILDAMREYKQMFRQSSQNISSQILADTDNHHYQFLWMGWKNDQHIFSVAFHIDILDGKIWIQRDQTEIGIANLLTEQGVPKSDIVLAYFPAAHRKFTEFAVA